MKIAVYGGSFNPPHLGHSGAAQAVSETLCPDRFLIIPDRIPPHKKLEEGSPSPEERFELCRLAFSGVPNAEISEMELEREGPSYTSDTVRALRGIYPAEDQNGGKNELILVLGTDMLLSFDTWHDFEYLLSECTLAVLSRSDGDDPLIRQKAAELTDLFGAVIEIIPHPCFDISSSEIRTGLKERKMREVLDDSVYSEIIRRRFYGACPELEWLRTKAYPYLDKKRIPHVFGCEKEAVRLAKRWEKCAKSREEKDQLAGNAAEAAILHDITKKLAPNEQLNLIRKYGIVCDNEFLNHSRLFHAATGAAFSKDLFGISEDVYNAIFRHTTASPDMTLLEKIIYLADYVECTRDFDGVRELRALCYEDIDAAMELGLKMGMADLKERGIQPYSLSARAYSYYHRLNINNNSTERDHKHADT